MVIDMVAVNEMQATIMDIVHVITVADHEVRIVFAMHVIGMQGGIERHFGGRVSVRNLDHMLVGMSIMHKVQVPVVKIIPVIDMPDFYMTAILTMHMRMVCVDLCGVIVRRESACARQYNHRPEH